MLNAEDYYRRKWTQTDCINSLRQQQHPWQPFFIAFVTFTPGCLNSLSTLSAVDYLYISLLKNSITHVRRQTLHHKCPFHKITICLRDDIISIINANTKWILNQMVNNSFLLFLMLINTAAYTHGAREFLLNERLIKCSNIQIEYIMKLISIYIKFK